jgi:hypothetical protein
MFFDLVSDSCLCNSGIPAWLISKFDSVGSTQQKTPPVWVVFFVGLSWEISALLFAVGCGMMQQKKGGGQIELERGNGEVV